MFNFSKADNAQLNQLIVGGLSGIVTTVVAGLINNYVVTPVVQKGVDKVLPVEEPVVLAEISEDGVNVTIEEDTSSK